MWINSLNIDDLYVNNLYEDGRNGLLWLKIIDHIQEGVVPWERVNKKKKKMNVYKRNENCSLAVKLMKEQFKFSLVGVGGTDLEQGYKKLCLACMWQLMRLYTVNLLCRLGGGKKIADKAIVKWANDKVACSGAATNNNDKKAHSMKSFRDPSLASGLFFMDLVFAMEPRSVNWEIVTPGASDDDRALNAKYVISCARKLGAAIFVTYEDIVEVNPKMVMLVTASLMALGLGFNEDDGEVEDVMLDEDEDVVRERAHRRSVARGKSMDIMNDDDADAAAELAAECK
jgi:plastin-1